MHSIGAIVCSRESDPGHACPTKLLWTKVRFSIVSTLRETTLADLRRGADRPTVATPAVPTGPELPAVPMQSMTTGA
jgi:hypothetical protein